MKYLKDIIQEKLVINKNTKIIKDNEYKLSKVINHLNSLNDDINIKWHVDIMHKEHWLNFSHNLPKDLIDNNFYISTIIYSTITRNKIIDKFKSNEGVINIKEDITKYPASYKNTPGQKLILIYDPKLDPTFV